jgi:hypothetical protein
MDFVVSKTERPKKEKTKKDRKSKKIKKKICLHNLLTSESGGHLTLEDCFLHCV